MEAPRPITARERAEALAARAVATLPPRVRRRIAGPPIVRDGLELDLDMQVMLRLNERNPRPAPETRTPAEARGDLARSARVVAGPPLAVARVERATAGGGP